jgi:O-antigen/teichoic acid export membrane protein
MTEAQPIPAPPAVPSADTGSVGPEPVPGAAAGGGRRLARVSLASFSLNVGNTVLAVVTTAVLAQLMGAAQLGIYAFVVATMTLLSVPAILGFDRLLIRDLAIQLRVGGHALAAGLLRRSLQVTLAIAVALALLAGLVAWLASGRVDGPLLAFWVGMIGLPFLAAGRVLEGGLMGLHRVVLGQFPEYLLRPLLLLAAIVLAVAVLGRIDAGVAVTLYVVTLAAATLVAGVLLRRRTPSEVRRAPPRYEDRAWLASALLLAFLSGTAIVNSQTGVVLLGLLADSEAAGLYAVAQRGALLVAFPLAAVNSAIAPTAARLWAAGERVELQRLVTLGARGVLLAALPVAGAFLAFGGPILALVFGAEFGAAATPLAVLSIGQLANAVTGSVAVLLVMTGHQRQAAIGTAAGAVLNVVVAAALIPRFGVDGAALAAAGSLVISNGWMVVAARRRLALDTTAVGLPPAGR